jgi:hypothetical protein
MSSPFPVSTDRLDERLGIVDSSAIDRPVSLLADEPEMVAAA